jgi:hypothetical protein
VGRDRIERTSTALIYLRTHMLTPRSGVVQCHEACDHCESFGARRWRASIFQLSKSTTQPCAFRSERRPDIGLCLPIARFVCQRICQMVLYAATNDTVVSGQINPDWDCLQANHMSMSSKTDNLICSIETLDDI